MLQHIDETRKSRMFNVKVGQCSVFVLFFFYQGLLSHTLKIHRRAGEGKKPSIYYSL